MKIAHISRASLVLCIVGVLGSGLAWAAEEGSSEGETVASTAHLHDYSIRIRPAVWIVNVDGGYETEAGGGRNLSIRVDGDLGYDETYPTFNGDVSLRRGRHELSVTGVLFDEDAEATAQVQFEIGGDPIQIGGVVKSRAELTDINFRYGYSFFELEEDGFRLGPTVAVSYTDLTVTAREISVLGIPTGAGGEFQETLPMPTLGIHGEIPWERLLFAGQVGGVLGRHR